jgi:hypothetical protein
VNRDERAKSFLCTPFVLAGIAQRQVSLPQAANGRFVVIISECRPAGVGRPLTSVPLRTGRSDDFTQVSASDDSSRPQAVIGRCRLCGTHFSEGAYGRRNPNRNSRSEYNSYKSDEFTAVCRSFALPFLHTIKHTSKVKPIENIWIKLGMGPGPVHDRYKYLKKYL